MNINDILSKDYKLSPADISILTDKMTIVNIAQKTLILDEGKQDHFIYIIEKGLVRSYITREDKHLTITIAQEGDIILSSPTITKVQACHFSLQALEDCTLWKIPRKELENILSLSHKLATWGRLVVEKWLDEYSKYFIEMYWMDKKEQYKYLLKQNPNLVQRVSVSDIASWLNVTPQSLSRIRAELD